MYKLFNIFVFPLAHLYLEFAHFFQQLTLSPPSSTTFFAICSFSCLLGCHKGKITLPTRFSNLQYINVRFLYDRVMFNQEKLTAVITSWCCWLALAFYLALHLHLFHLTDTFIQLWEQSNCAAALSLLNQECLSLCCVRVCTLFQQIQYFCNVMLNSAERAFFLFTKMHLHPIRAWVAAYCDIMTFVLFCSVWCKSFLVISLISVQFRGRLHPTHPANWPSKSHWKDEKVQIGRNTKYAAGCSFGLILILLSRVNYIPRRS